MILLGNVFVDLFGLMIFLGRVISNINENVNIKWESRFNLKESYFIVDVIWNYGFEWLLIRVRFELMKRFFWLNVCIVVVLVRDLVKWWRIGVFFIFDMCDSFFVVGV